ncbi:MAG: hypothetical protein K9G46_07755 [Flavobacteriales bacterium]|nr:hypothetical protein [Flavobacteriales bacterium]
MKPIKLADGVEKGFDQIMQCLRSSSVVEMFETYNLLHKQQKGLPYFTYFGLNFKEDSVVSIKVYFHWFSQLDKEELEKFLPFSDHILEYYPYHAQSDFCNPNYTGCAFEVKFKDGQDEVIGFYLRLKACEETFKALGRPKSLPDWMEIKLNPAINFEYSNEEVLLKKYYYFDEPETNKYFADRFELPFLNKAHLIEFAESDSFCKINTMYGNDLFDLATEVNRFGKNENELIQKLNDKYGLINAVYGFYERQDIKSVYFFDKQLNLNPVQSRLDIGNIFYVDTMSKVLA